MLGVLREAHRALLLLRGVTHNSESYLQLLGTYSSHRALNEGTRQRLFAAVTRLIDEEYEGSVVEGYRSELYVARRH